MLRRSQTQLRTLSKWRHLIHPLSPAARKDQWFKRDLTGRNEALLRRPYYTLRPQAAESSPAVRDATVSAPSVIGPQPPWQPEVRRTAGLRPNYPEAWDVIPPHDPARENH